MPVDSVPPVAPLPILEASPANAAAPSNGAFSRELAANRSGTNTAESSRDGQNSNGDQTRSANGSSPTVRERNNSSAVRTGGTKRGERDQTNSANVEDAAVSDPAVVVEQSSDCPTNDCAAAEAAAAEEDASSDLQAAADEEIVAALDVTVAVVAPVVIASPIEDAVVVAEDTTAAAAPEVPAIQAAAAAPLLPSVPTAASALQVEVAAEVASAATVETPPEVVASASPIVVAPEAPVEDEVAKPVAEKNPDEAAPVDKVPEVKGVAKVDTEASAAAQQSSADESTPDDQNSKRPLVERPRGRSSAKTAPEQVTPNNDVSAATKKEGGDNSGNVTSSTIAAPQLVAALQNLDLSDAAGLDEKASTTIDQAINTAAAAVAATTTDPSPNPAANVPDNSPPPIVPVQNHPPSRFQVTIGGQHLHAAAHTRPPEVDTTRFLQRVSRAFAVAEARGGDIRLRLSPPELGAIQLEVGIKAGVLTARIETETSAAQSVLLDNLPQLRERLAEQGMQIEKFDVNVADRQSQGMPDFSQSEREGQQQAARQRAAALQAANAKTPALAARRSDGTSDGDGLNVLV